jgi:hypothetical protein
MVMTQGIGTGRDDQVFANGSNDASGLKSTSDRGGSHSTKHNGARHHPEGTKRSCPSSYISYRWRTTTQGAMMRFRTSKKQKNGTCGEGNYCVQIYSRRASLVSEFCLDTQVNRLPNMETAAQLLRETLIPCDFASASVALINDDGSDRQEILEFDLRHAE